MKILSIIIGGIAILSVVRGDVSMAGIKINNPETVIGHVKMEVLATEQYGKTRMVKYLTENGNHFSVTASKGKIVYLENDWLQSQDSKTPMLTDFVFGETSLKDIRIKFGTNGFTHANQSYIRTATHLIMFNCFDVDLPSSEVLVVITKMPLESKVTEENVADLLKLDALILSTSKYLDSIWGKKKVYDPNYKKVKI